MASLVQVDKFVVVGAQPHIALEPVARERCGCMAASLAHILRPWLAIRMNCSRVLSRENDGAKRARSADVTPSGTSLRYGDAEDGRRERDAMGLEGRGGARAGVAAASLPLS